ITGWSLKRPGDLLNSLAAAALIILIWDPQQLFQAGFQLSFFVVLSIALFLPPLEKIRDRLLRPDPLLPPDLVPRWQRWLGARLPGAFFYVPSPSLVDFAIYYCALFAVLSGYALARQRRIGTVTIAVCLAGFYVWKWQAARATVTLTVLPLNGGSSVYVRAHKS